MLLVSASTTLSLSSSRWSFEAAAATKSLPPLHVTAASGSDVKVNQAFGTKTKNFALEIGRDRNVWLPDRGRDENSGVETVAKRLIWGPRLRPRPDPRYQHQARDLCLEISPVARL